MKTRWAKSITNYCFWCGVSSLYTYATNWCLFSPIYMPLMYNFSSCFAQCPNTEQEWINVAQGFEERWDFPNCMGALDGKHIAVVPPPRSGSLFHNYKGGFSLLLLALCNANYEIMYVDCGAEGRVGDAAVWNRCTLKVLYHLFLYYRILKRYTSQYENELALSST